MPLKVKIMKTLLFIGLSLCSFNLLAQPGANPVVAESNIAFKTLTIERADIAYDAKDPFIFEFTNTGTEPMLILEARPSCGCTTPEKPTEPIAAKQSSRLVVNYDTKRVGPFTKTITVVTNTSPDPVVLTIKGNVLPSAEATPSVIAPPTY